MKVSDRVRVLLLSGAPGVGGGERATIPALAEDGGLDVTVAGYGPVCQYAAKYGFKNIELELPFVSGVRRTLPLGSGAVRVASLARRIRAEVLYANGSRAMPYAVFSRLLGSPPLMVHHHGLFTMGPKRALVRGIELSARAIIVPSGTVASEFNSTTKVHIIPNGIDLDHFLPAENRPACKRTLGIPESEIVVGTVGRAAPGKGMDSFIRVVSQIAERRRDVRFLVVGGAVFPHEQAQYEAIKRETARLGDRIVLTGYLDDPVPALQAMDVFVHLGDPEGFGLAVVEAMACANPVVAYRWGGVAEIIEHDLSGLLLAPKQEGEVIEAVLRLIGDSVLRSDLGMRGREVCEQKYGLSRMAAQLSQIVRMVSR